MKKQVLILLVIAIGSWRTNSMAADPFSPSLSLAKAAQIADAKISEAKLPADQFLRSIRIQYLPNNGYCYIASYEPPVMTGWVGNTPPAQKPLTVHYLQINMDGTAAFETKTVGPK